MTSLAVAFGGINHSKTRKGRRFEFRVEIRSPVSQHIDERFCARRTSATAPFMLWRSSTTVDFWGPEPAKMFC
jgi:hypothetical protein